MEWLGLHFCIELPKGGQLLSNCTHQPFLVALAYVVACAGSFATLDVAERVGHAEKPAARRRWCWVGALCLAGEIWAMHFISMLALMPPIDTHFDLSTTLSSLLIALTTSLMAMLSLSHQEQRTSHYVRAGVWMGLGVCAMHYVGMAALHSDATQYYQPWLAGISLLTGVGSSIAALLLARYFRDASGLPPKVLKLLAGLMVGAGIASTHFIGIWSLHLVVPSESLMHPDFENNHLQLALTVAMVALLIIGSSITAAMTDKKLQSKEVDLRRVNALLSQLDQARMSLQQVAHYDALTNLVNRRGFNQIFAEKLIERSSQGGMLAVVFLDIDHFKRINDSLGHDAGDELLKTIAGHIKHATRSHDDVVARFGGDEFCILINLHDRDEARHMAQRIMQKMKEPIELSGRRLVMTTSIGISIFPDDGKTSEELLKNADLALYQSKGSGRNSLHFFSPHLKTRATLELQIEEELRNALRDGVGLTLHYQPIFDLKTGQVAKLEALIRWQHPQHGLLTPDRFIAIAETNGLIAELDNWVLRRACQDIAKLSSTGGENLRVAVNCSALNLVREELPAEIENALHSAGVPPQRLELEVTENALMGNINNTLVILRQIRALGVTLSVDDFGTGYSSLAYLKRLPLDTLKVDRSFIQGIPNSIQDMEIVQAIIVMAHTLHLSVVTEGVDTRQQYEFLQQHGCDFIQGYLLSRPVPLEELQPLLQSLNHPLSRSLDSQSGRSRCHEDRLSESASGFPELTSTEAYHSLIAPSLRLDSGAPTAPIKEPVRLADPSINPRTKIPGMMEGKLHHD